jgi:hypothetical protein
MSRRKSEITGHMNERDFPHIVELELPPGGFRSQSLEFDAFHHDRGIPIRRGRGRHEAEQFHVRFCFPDTATADAFREGRQPYLIVRKIPYLIGALRRHAPDLFTVQARAPLRPKSAVPALLLAAYRRWHLVLCECYALGTGISGPLLVRHSGRSDLTRS